MVATATAKNAQPPLDTFAPTPSPELPALLTQLARIALAGRDQDVHTFVRRTAKALRSTDPATAAALVGLLRDQPTARWPLHGTVDTPLPVDLDSRLPLFRVDYPEAGRKSPILPSETSDQINQLVAERRAAGKLLAAGLDPARASLFTGPPGVGKTMAAGWIAAQLGLPLIVLDLSTVMSSYLGKTGGNLRSAFDYAKRNPCVFFLDEIDAVGKKRSDDSDIGELKRLVTVLLQQLDDWPSSAGLLLAATNHGELLDPALWRRFDTTVTFALPDESARRATIELYAGTVLDHTVVSAFAKATEGWSFNDIERELHRIRKKAILDDQPLDELILEAVEHLD